MLPPLAGLDDLTVPYTDPAVALAKLRSASTRVRSFVGLDYVDEEGELVEDIPDEVVTVVIDAAERAIVNPRGVTGEQVGQYSYQIASGGGGGIYLTKQEKAMLRAIRGGSGISSVKMESNLPDHYGNTVYLPVTDGGDWVPYEAG